MDGFENKEIKVLNELYNRSVIHDSVFEIKEYHLKEYMTVYGDLFSESNRRMTSSDIRLARKLAGRTLIKYNLHIGASLSDIKAGMVYVISNPAYPDHFKIGMTVDLKKRLSSFQTYDPFRKFKVEHYEFVLNRRDVERDILSKFCDDSDVGEWVSREDKDSLISMLLVRN